jgi:manganese transport protein
MKKFRTSVGIRPTLKFKNDKHIRFANNGSFFKKFLAFLGPGYLVAVGYMDPGNWATDIAGGSQFAYSLLFVILLSNIMAMILQSLSGKLGIVTGKNLAQLCKEHYSKPMVFFLWFICEIAIAACDLAELIGSAIALKLLFGIPLLFGIIITSFDVLIILFLQNKNIRAMELFVIVLIITIGLCFGIELLYANPNMKEVMNGFIPNSSIIHNREMLYVAIGIVGATVMPHNLYLHSYLVQTKNTKNDNEGKKEAIKFVTLDSTLALVFAFFINASILIVSASVFNKNGQTNVNDIEQAYNLLSPMLGVTIASILFGVALLASGQNSTLTGTLAGQVVMEGFLDIKLKPWIRRLITRLVAIIPAILVTAFVGEKATTELLILSQVILSFQLAFAVVPLIRFTNSKIIMKDFANSLWLKVTSWLIAIFIISLNLYLLIQFLYKPVIQFIYH